MLDRLKNLSLASLLALLAFAGCENKGSVSTSPPVASSAPEGSPPSAAGEQAAQSGMATPQLDDEAVDDQGFIVLQGNAASGAATTPPEAEATVPQPAPAVAETQPDKSPNPAQATPAVPANPPEKSQKPVEANVASDAERNQQIAADWPQPQAVLFVSGQQHGYLEPCGCTGLENQKGGLIRRG